MIKKLIGILILLILGIIVVIGIKEIKANTSRVRPAKTVHAVALNQPGAVAHSNLQLVDLNLTQAQEGLHQRLLHQRLLHQRLLSANSLTNALELTALQGLLKPDMALTLTSVDLGLLSQNA